MSYQDLVLGLKIDVDTFRGMKEGVPRLMEILARLEIKGSFFLSMGPDASGLAIFQLIKNPRFWKKMLRSRATELYGWKTALYGTLIPSPLIALSFPEQVRSLIAEGHEVALHAWDHRRWQDTLPRRDEGWIRTWFEKGIGAFKSLTGRPPRAFGAPGWVMDERALAVVCTLMPVDYLSCTRAQEPFLYRDFGVLELPSDLPCIEEVGIEGVREKLREMHEKGGVHILPVHAEVEGGVWSTQFEALLKEVLSLQGKITTLEEIANLIDKKSLPIRIPILSVIPGRASPCLV